MIVVAICFVNHQPALSVTSTIIPVITDNIIYNKQIFLLYINRENDDTINQRTTSYLHGDRGFTLFKGGQGVYPLHGGTGGVTLFMGGQGVYPLHGGTGGLPPRLNVSDKISVFVCFVFFRSLNLFDVEIVAPLNM